MLVQASQLKKSRRIIAGVDAISDRTLCKVLDWAREHPEVLALIAAMCFVVL